MTTTATGVDLRLDSPSGPPDREIVLRVRGGDREAFGFLVRRYQKPLYRHARGVGLDHDTGLDLVQEALVRAYERLPDCANPERFGPWVHRILRNQCLDHLKNVRRRTVPLSDGIAPEIEPSAQRALERKELREAIREALDQLPADLREAFVLKHHEGWTYEEIAEAADASVSAVKMRVHRARDALRAALLAAGVGVESPPSDGPTDGSREDR